MTRMFDILRNKSHENKNNQKDKKPEVLSLISQKLISSVKRQGIDNQEKSREIYEKALETVKVLLENIRLKENLPPYMDKLYNLLDDIFNQLILGNSILDNLYISEIKKDEDYLSPHIVNTLILSSFIGINMGFNKSRLNQLGLASIFYDVGMVSLEKIASQPKKLTTEEHTLLKGHIAKSLEAVEGINSIDQAVKETIHTHHERINGKGYPLGLKSEELNLHTKIIGLIDTYEALTNNRPHRQSMSAHKAIRFIIYSLKDSFDPEVIKVFINKMSIYPIGSIIRLDTQELAKVIGVSPGSPFRPVVAIIQDALGNPVKEINIIDLSKQDSVAIKESI